MLISLLEVVAVSSVQTSGYLRFVVNSMVLKATENVCACVEVLKEDSGKQP